MQSQGKGRSPATCKNISLFNLWVHSFKNNEGKVSCVKPTKAVNCSGWIRECFNMNEHMKFNFMLSKGRDAYNR